MAPLATSWLRLWAFMNKHELHKISAVFQIRSSWKVWTARANLRLEQISVRLFSIWLTINI